MVLLQSTCIVRKATSGDFLPLVEKDLLLQTFTYGTEEYFRFNLIKGQIAKELVKGLLETSGYQVYPFGYESSISQLRYDVQRKDRVPPTDSNNKMRSMPDLIVYDEEKHETSFVEVKYRKANSPEHVTLYTRELTWNQKYWNECIFVVVIPTEHNFYAQKISKVTIFNEQKSHKYNLLKDFVYIEAEFPRVKPENITKYKAIREQFTAVVNSEQEETGIRACPAAPADPQTIARTTEVCTDEKVRAIS